MSIIKGLILGAGKSSRFGSDKLSHAINGQSVIEWCIRPMYEVCEEIIVVTGCHDISHILKKYPKVHPVQNRHYQEGMFSSIKAGLKQMSCDRFFLTPGDYPGISESTYSLLLQYPDDIVIPSYHGQKGHPLLLSHNLVIPILKSEEESLQAFLEKRPCRIVETGDLGILYDIDTPEDAFIIKGMMGANER